MRVNPIVSLLALALAAACSAEDSTGTGRPSGTGTGTSTGSASDPCRGVVCSALDQCHDIGRCDPTTGRCTDPAKPDATPCDDGDGVTRDDACRAGICKGIDRCAGVTCAPKDQCHDAGACDPETGACSHPERADATPCDDGDARTVQDACAAGACVGKDLCAGVTCTPKDQCHDAGACDPQTGLCSEPSKADGTGCDDGDAATINDACSAGRCAGIVADGETCARAVLLTAPYQATRDLTGAAGDYNTSTGCATRSGRDRVFAVDVPAGQRLYASVRGSGTFDPSLSLVGDLASCTAAPTCLASDDTGSAASLNAVTHVNDGPTTRRYFLIVDTLSTASGSFELRAVVGAPLAGETCADAAPVPFVNGLASLPTESVDLYANDYRSGTSCTGFSGGERVYRFEVPAGNTATFTVTPAAAFDASVNVVAAAATGAPESACGSPMTCAAGANAGGAGITERAVYRNAGSTAQDVFVTVEAATSTTTPGTFALEAELSAGLPGDTCASAAPVRFVGTTASLSGQTLLGFASDYGSGTGCLATAGPDRGYLVTIPAGKALTATATSSSSALDPSLNVVDAAACGASPRFCLAGAGTTGATETVRYANAGAAPLDVVVFVETSATTVAAPGTFDLRFTLSDLPLGETCSTAVPVVAGTTSTQTLLGYANDYRSGALCSGTGGPDRVYKVLVPAGDELTATVTPAAGWDPSINLQLADGCGLTRACLDGSDAGGSGAPDTATWRNVTGAPAEVFVVVETYTSTAPATGNLREFTLTVQLATPPPPPAGDLCANATPAAPGTTASQTLVGYRNDYPGDTASGCAGTAGPDRLYVVSVPAGQRLTATVQPRAASTGATWDPAINLQTLAACSGPRTCLAGSDDGLSGDEDTATWTNTGASAVDVYVAVETYSTAAPGAGATRDFDLVVALDVPPPAPPGDTCSDADPPIAATTTLANESLSGSGHDYGPASGLCETVSGASGGLDRAYRVTIPSGRTLTARLTPDATWDPTLSLVLGPAAACAPAMTCVAGADRGLRGAAEELSYTNTGAAAVDGFLVVDGWRPSGATTYTYGLTITIVP